jgi:hypothetical protein
MAMQELMALVPMMNGDGRNNALNELIAASQGVDKITAFNPPIERIDQDQWMAGIENDSLHNGNSPEVISGMDHVVHLQIHTEDAEQRLAPLQEQIEMGGELDEAGLQEAFEYVAVLGEHCDLHLQELENDPSRKDLYQLFKSKLDLLVAFHGKLRGAIRKVRAQAAQAAREEQAEIALGALDQAKLASAQQDMAIKAAKEQQNMGLKDKKTTADIRRKNFQAAQSTKLGAAKTASEINLSRVKTAAEVQTKKAKASNGSTKKTK